MKDIFEAKEKLDELCECLIEEYVRTKNPEVLKSIKECSAFCFRLGRILHGFGLEAP